MIVGPLSTVVHVIEKGGTRVPKKGAKRLSPNRSSGCHAQDKHWEKSGVVRRYELIMTVLGYESRHPTGFPTWEPGAIRSDALP